MKRIFPLVLLTLFPALAYSEILDFSVKDQQRRTAEAQALSQRSLEKLQYKYRQAVRKGNSAAILGYQALLKQHESPPASRANVYLSKISSSDEGKLLLANGAEIKISDSFLGFLSFNNNCILFSDGASWKIWIEGKQTYSCDLVRAPQVGNPVKSTTVTISAVSQDGSVLELLDGSTLKVDSLDEIKTQLLMPYTDALLLATGKLVIIKNGMIVTVEIGR